MFERNPTFFSPDPADVRPLGGLDPIRFFNDVVIGRVNQIEEEEAARSQIDLDGENARAEAKRLVEDSGVINEETFQRNPDETLFDTSFKTLGEDEPDPIL